MERFDFPRVLIVGHSFSGVSGASITLRNLFKGWPIEKIAVLSLNIDESDNVAFEYCANYYRFGNKEIKVLPILRPFFKVNRSRIITQPKVNSKPNLNKHISTLRLIVKKFLIKTGLYSIRFKYTISDGLLQWYKQFNPQIVYSALGDIDIIKFMLEIKKIDNVPLAVHVWDDWPNTLANRTIFKKYWQNKIDYYFRTIISKSELLLSISGEMSNVYKKLYNRDFITFHNPIELDVWEGKPDPKNRDLRTILYVGKINEDTIDLLVLMAKVIDEISDIWKSIKFDIYSPNLDLYIESFKPYSRTFLNKALPHNQIIGKIKNADLLFLPLGFSEKTISYTKLSMPTKASEFMISNVPIIVMAPSEIALTKYAESKKWALVVDKYDLETLKNAVLKIINDNDYSNILKNTAFQLCKKNHDAKIVRKRFMLYLKEYAKHE